MSIIKLDVDSTITRLAGNPYGEEIYNTQVKDKIDFSSKNTIVVPENIEDVAISFVQGFTKNIFSKIDKEDFYNYFNIEGKVKVVNKFRKSIYF